jgi:hypothetical protein
MKSEFFNSPRISTARWDESCRCIVIDSKVSFNRGDQVMEMKSREVWRLEDGGKVLKITQTSTGFRGGENSATWVYGKQGM